MQASTNIRRTPERREGRRKLLAVAAALVMAVAALLLTLALSSSIGPSNAAVQKELPYTFFFTHYQLLGDPNNPDGVRYHSNGKPSAKAPNGSEVTLSGKGGWNPKNDTAKGGGHYTIKGSSGAVKAQGSWRVTGFSSFEQFSGWWGMGPDFKEKGWQGPPGSASFSGFLTLEVSLENQGDGILVAWCLMPQVLKRHPHLANPDDHVGDGISLSGGKFDFTNFEENEMSLEGVMFYSTDRGIVKCCGSGSVDHAATFFSFASTSSPFLNSAPALTNATR